MGRVQNGSLCIFRLFGISVFVHWSWVLVAALEIAQRRGAYRTPVWNLVEYLTLFLLVLMHEFGHALACRSVGGSADRIMLWPLGGVAYVSPPLRPGALLWSITAGPLVNLILLPLTVVALVVEGAIVGPSSEADMALYCRAVALMNAVLLAFNLLPFYPLDGGQILRALLWFVVGPIRSLQAAAVVGLIGAAGLVLVAITWHDQWLIILAVYAGFRSWVGLASTRALTALLSAPRHTGWRCAHCGEAPVVGEYWKCTCGAHFDIFAHGAVCPSCNTAHAVTTCPFCGRSAPLEAWQVMPEPVVPPVQPAWQPADNTPP